MACRLICVHRICSCYVVFATQYLTIFKDCLTSINIERKWCYGLGIVPPWLEKILNFASLECLGMPITPIFSTLNLVMNLEFGIFFQTPLFCFRAKTFQPSPFEKGGGANYGHIRFLWLIGWIAVCLVVPLHMLNENDRKQT